MNKQKLVDLFKTPSLIDEKYLEEIEEVVKENPYFHSAYSLIAVGKKKFDPKSANKDLIRAAIYSTNRINLKKYLQSGLGGSQSTSAKDAVIEPPVQKEKPQAKEKVAPVVAATPVKDPKRTKIQPKPVNKEESKVKTVTKPTDLDLDKILDSIKTEYQQLEVNMRNFEEAEKSLSEAEIKEASEVKKARSTPTKASAAKKPTTSKATTTRRKTSTTTKASTAVKPKKAPAKTASTKAVTAKKDTASTEEDSPVGDSDSKKKEQKKLIDNFIKSEPRIAANKNVDSDPGNQEDLSSKNQILTDDMVTENLANIMVKQGRFEKAIEIYNKLIWKFPHKKAYFAGRIKELKEQ